MARDGGDVEADRQRRTNAERARSAHEGMQAGFSMPATKLYRGHYPPRSGDHPYAYHWPFSQALSATIDMAGFMATVGPAVAAGLAGLTAYWDARPARGLPGYASNVLPPLGTGGDKFYDDNAWAGVALTRVYRMTGDQDALDRGRAVFAFVIDGWAKTQVCDGAAGTGGIFWKQQSPTETIRDRNTVSNAPNAELGLILHQLTGEQAYLRMAMSMYDWVNTYLRDPVDGLYWDHVGTDAGGRCVIERTKWSYNQGTMIGANVLLHRVTGDAYYLDQAKRIAGAALERYGCVNGCTAASEILDHGPAFNAIFFRNLLLLASADPNPAYLLAMQTYADTIWSDHGIRQSTPNGTLFAFRSGHVDLLNQAAMVQIYACLAWDPAKYHAIV